MGYTKEQAQDLVKRLKAREQQELLKQQHEQEHLQYIYKHWRPISKEYEHKDNIAFFTYALKNQEELLELIIDRTTDTVIQASQY